MAQIVWDDLYQLNRDDMVVVFDPVGINNQIRRKQCDYAFSGLSVIVAGRILGSSG